MNWKDRLAMAVFFGPWAATIVWLLWEMWAMVGGWLAIGGYAYLAAGAWAIYHQSKSDQF